MKKAYYYIDTHIVKVLSVCEMENPLTNQNEKRILFQENATTQKVIVLRTEEKGKCIAFYYDRSKGDGARKIKRESMMCSLALVKMRCKNTSSINFNSTRKSRGDLRINHAYVQCIQAILGIKFR